MTTGNRRHAPPRGITLMANGYEILRPVKGTSPAWGTHALMGKPATSGRMHPPLWLTREVFNAYRANGWIQKLKPYRTKGWQVWGITGAGRQESLRQPKPSPQEIRAARAASKAKPGRRMTTGESQERTGI